MGEAQAGARPLGLEREGHRGFPAAHAPAQLQRAARLGLDQPLALGVGRRRLGGVAPPERVAALVQVDLGPLGKPGLQRLGVVLEIGRAPCRERE